MVRIAATAFTQRDRIENPDLLLVVEQAPQQGFGRQRSIDQLAGLDGLGEDADMIPFGMVQTGMQPLPSLLAFWQMLKQDSGGVIVNCASVAGLTGFAGMPAYVASKHGVVGLTKVAALDYARKGIRVNAVCPGAIITPMLERVMGDDEEARQGIVANEPVGRLGAPEEIANAVLWLCGDGASFITGQAIAVDGGWTAR